MSEKKDAQSLPSQGASTDTICRLAGARLKLVMSAICLALFLVTIEITIVNTSLVTIANDLSSFDRSSWIVTAYLLTYVGFLIVISQLANIIGRKPVLIASLSWFTIWAAVCGASQTTTQLIIFRAFQGIGAAGCYSSIMILIFELYPPSKIPLVAAGVSIVTTCSVVLGPVFGGLINRSGRWRWIFLFNAPAGFVAVVALQLLLPQELSSNSDVTKSLMSRKLRIRSSVHRIDIFGAFTLLSASVLLVAALENAGSRHAWSSALVAAPLAISAALWLALLLWERFLTMQAGVREPVFPWRFLTNRQTLGMYLTDFLLGPPSLASIYSLPQRFEVVNGSSPLGAGVRILPYTAVTSISSLVLSALAAKAQIPVLYIIIFGSICQTLGFGLLSFVPITTDILPVQYGYMALAAIGTGANMTLLIVLSPYLVEKRDAAIAQGVIGQLRYIGAAVGVAIVTCTFNSYVQSHLLHVLPFQQVEQLLTSVSSISSLPVQLQVPVRLVMAQAYNLQIRILMGFSAAQLVASLLMWQRQQVVLAINTEK